MTSKEAMSRPERNEPASRRRPPARGRRTVSYLVRFWEEPREEAGEAALYRGYARNLETGEESYFGDPRRLGEHILRRLREERREAAEAGGSEAMRRTTG